MQKEQSQLDKILSAALIQIVDQRPLYYSILTRIPKFFRNDLNRPCALGIDQNTGRLSILLNAPVLTAASVDHLQVVLEHLLFHILAPQHHEDRIKEGESFHLACDLIINQNISQIRDRPNAFSKKSSVLGKLLTPQALTGLHGFSAESLASTSVYELWPLLKKENHLPDLESYQTLDETDFQLHNFVSISRWQKLAPGNDILLQNQVKHTVTAAMLELHRLGKGPGRLPGNLSKYITAILAESQIDYSSLLQKFVGRAPANHKQRTWTRTNRKYPNLIKGSIRNAKENPRMLVIMDTSGSMWDDSTLKKVLAEIDKIYRVCPDLWVIGGDVVEKFRYFLKKGAFTPSPRELFGGGGTDLQFGFNAAKELDVDGTIVLTDGAIPTFDTHKIETTFVIVPEGIAIPGYDNIL
ncbi:MAG: hypothetical protein IPK04_15935 [Bdellovibrionales bacterium]|nr:hypothetical protein [Bdellovibrionales bacterium]